MLRGKKLFVYIMVAITVCSALSFAGTAVAQEEGDGALPEVYQEQAADASEQQTLMPWQQAWKTGGLPVQVLMYVLMGMSFLAVTLIVYFFAVLRDSEIVPRKTLHDVLARLKKGQIEEARITCEARPSPLSAVALVAIDYVKSMGASNQSLIKDVIQGEGTRQAESIQGQTQYLLDIGVIAPMIGLLGTVFGMLKAFSAVALDIAQAKPVVLANGVAQALITTASGLIVGIPAMMFYSYFRRKASKLVSRLETASAEVMMALAETESDKDEFQA